MLVSDFAVCSVSEHAEILRSTFEQGLARAFIDRSFVSFERRAARFGRQCQSRLNRQDSLKRPSEMA